MSRRPRDAANQQRLLLDRVGHYTAAAQDFETCQVDNSGAFVLVDAQTRARAHTRIWNAQQIFDWLNEQQMLWVAVNKPSNKQTNS